MVFSQLTALMEDETCKPSKNYLHLPLNPPDATSDSIELDFSDTFGPLPAHRTSEITNEIMYDDPVVICNRSHSLVGPTPRVSHLLNLKKLTICETEELEDFNDAAIEGFEENREKVQSVGIEDFEVMKVVGQGAFGKVYQVRKKDNMEIYAMKVVRKDKIVEKNHAEYMKAERDILTKIDHPFIVQLRYSFQVLLILKSKLPILVFHIFRVIIYVFTSFVFADKIQTLPCFGLCEWRTSVFPTLSPRAVSVSYLFIYLYIFFNH